MKVLYPITLDTKKTNVQKVIHANQGEGLDRKLIVTLVSGNDTIILDNENQSVQFVAKKPDGTTIYNATAIKDGKVIIYLTTQTVAAVGDVDCQLEVVSTDEGSVGSGVIYSAKFTIAVEEALYNDDTITSSNEFTELIELIERAEKQVTVFTGEGTPSDDPDEYDNIKESDFYYDSTNKTYRYAKSVTTTIAWEGLIRATYFNEVISYINETLNAKADKSTTYTKTEVDTALLTKADKSTTYTKTEVDTALSSKQNTLSEGNGIAIENDEVAVALESGMSGNILSFDNEYLTLHGDTVASDSAFKSELADYVYTESEVDDLLDNKQGKLTAGTNITIDSNNVISATGGGSGGSYTAGDGIDISNDEISVKLYNSQDNALMFNSDGTLVLFKSVLSRDSSFRSYLADTSVQNPLQPKLTAGTNITIDSNNVISASGGGGTSDYTDLTNKPSINSVTLSGNKTASDLGLQDKLTPGEHISIKNNVISVGGEVEQPFTVYAGFSENLSTTSSLVYPFVPVYSDSIGAYKWTGIKLNVVTTGQLNIITLDRNSTGYNTCNPTVVKTLTIANTGVQTITFDEPIVVAANRTIGLDSSDVKFKYNTNETEHKLPFLYKVSGASWNTSNNGLGIDFYGTRVVNEDIYGSTYYGKSLSILGDSISTFTGYIPSGNVSYYPSGSVAKVTDTWWKKLIDGLDMKLELNNSWSGSRVTTTSGTDSAGVTRASNLGTNPDVIIVYMGINDFNNEVALGTYDGTTALPASTETTTFREAYALMLDTILTTYKEAEVWVCTLPQCERNSPTGFPEINGNGDALVDFNNAILELAEAFGVKVLNHNKCGLTYQNMSVYNTDQLHTNKYGHSLIANNDLREMDGLVRTRYDIK